MVRSVSNPPRPYPQSLGTDGFCYCCCCVVGNLVVSLVYGDHCGVHVVGFLGNLPSWFLLISSNNEFLADFFNKSGVWVAYAHLD